jgi:predicted peptidase
VDGHEYRYRVHLPPGWSQEQRWPVILFLHGAGGYGSDGYRQTTEGLGPAIRRHPERFGAIVVFPQVPASGTPGWQTLGGRIALASLDEAIRDYGGDRSRVALTGLSVGGNGAWSLAYRYPDRFKALLVVCGFVSEFKGSMYRIVYPSLVPGTTDPFPAVAQRIAGVPIWVFHGDADGTVPVEQSRRMVAALRAVNARVQYTELPRVGHDAWEVAYERPDVASFLLGGPLAPTSP